MKTGIIRTPVFQLGIHPAGIDPRPPPAVVVRKGLCFPRSLLDGIVARL
jgi:hypothetical protein